MPGETKKVKLIRKTSKAFLVISALLMLTSTIVLYFYVKSILAEELEDELNSIQDRVENSLREDDKFYSLQPVVEVKKVQTPGTDFLKDTLIYDPSQEDIELFRELSTFKNIKDQNYQITVRSLVVETEDILIAIVTSYIIIIVFALVLLFYFNKSWNKKLWRPFFANLEQMKGFSIKSNNSLQLVESDVEEFSELSDQISILVDKVKNDYENLKQYTEDVSHEIQTPLAIIQAKIENIINENSIDERNYESLTSIQQDIKRLTQLNKRLTLLTKIDNNQFTGIEEINISEVLKALIENFKELTPAEIVFTPKSEIEVKMDPYLAELLCNNLIANAIKHGKKKENRITIEIEGNTLSVANFGDNGFKNPEKLFSRFYRGKASIQKSSGLGLAIVKKICDFYGFRVNYNFVDNQHTFYISFG